jgi:hypothetical protein
MAGGKKQHETDGSMILRWKEHPASNISQRSFHVSEHSLCKRRRKFNKGYQGCEEQKVNGLRNKDQSESDTQLREWYV